MRHVGPAALLGVLWLLVPTAGAVEFEKLEVTEDGGRFDMDTVVLIEAQPAQVRSVIVDFDRLDRLSESIRSARRLPRPEHDDIQVATHMKVCVGPFCRYASQVQQVVMDGPDRIIASAIAERSDFEVNESVWEISADPVGTRLHYRMRLDPKFWVPPLIGTALIKRSMRKHGEEMAANLERLAQEEDG